jgi:hypothetical protein
MINIMVYNNHEHNEKWEPPQRERKNKLTYFDLNSTEPTVTSVNLPVSCCPSASALVCFSVSSPIPSSELQRTRHILQESNVLQSPGKLSSHSKGIRGCCQDTGPMCHSTVLSRKTQTTVIPQHISYQFEFLLIQDAQLNIHFSICKPIFTISASSSFLFLLQTDHCS